MLKESVIHRISFDENGTECYAQLEGDFVEIGYDDSTATFGVDEIDKLIEMLQRLYAKRFGLTPGQHVEEVRDGMWAARQSLLGMNVRRKIWDRNVDCRDGMQVHLSGEIYKGVFVSNEDILGIDWEVCGTH